MEWHVDLKVDQHCGEIIGSGELADVSGASLRSSELSKGGNRGRCLKAGFVELRSFGTANH
jgi:hypothetical protein